MMLQAITYTIAVAAVLSAVGWCAERFARLQRLPRRAVWVAAMVLSVLLPAAMILLARPEELSRVRQMNPEPVAFTESSATRLPAPVLPPVAIQAAPAASSTSGASGSTWKLPRPSDRVLITAWLAVSSALALYLLGANLLLRRRVQGWHRATVQNREVLVSEVTGPALLGAFSPRIIVPRWLLLQPQRTQALILEHEHQHVLARDALLIMWGLVALVAVPWNLPLWWQWRRLRQAIELDCDARVLAAGAEANTYAQVLLAVTQRCERTPTGALAMSEPVHALEQRIANLLPDAIRYARLQSVAVLLLAAAGASATLALEAPALPGRAAAPPMATPQGIRTPAAITAAQSTIIAAAAPAPRAVEPTAAAQTPVLAHLATKPSSFTVRIHSPVAKPSPLSIRMARVTGAPSTSGDADAAARAMLEKYYAILVEKLRSVPGLKLITEGTPDNPEVRYEISMGLGADWKGVVIEATSVQNPSRPRVQTTTRDASEFVKQLSPEAQDSVPADDPERDMARYVERLRVELFPPDRALLDQLMSELRNPQLSPGLRAEALRKLMTIDSLYDSSGARVDSFGGRISTYQPDPALLGAATEVAITATDPEVRLWLWDTLITGGLVSASIDPRVFVAPAGRGLTTENDPRVQLMLVDILSLSTANPQARAALESVANSEERGRPELVRMAARRLVNNGAGWNDYVMSRLSDPQVPDTERLELLAYVSSISGRGRWGRSGTRMKLDEAAQRGLGSLLKSGASAEVVAAAARLLGEHLVPVSPEDRGSPVAREELIDFMRTGTGNPEFDPKVRRSALVSLDFGLRSSAETRQLFEEIAARDLDPALRAAARQALDRTPQK